MAVAVIVVVAVVVVVGGGGSGSGSGAFGSKSLAETFEAAAALALSAAMGDGHCGGAATSGVYTGGNNGLGGPRWYPWTTATPEGAPPGAMGAAAAAPAAVYRGAWVTDGGGGIFPAASRALLFCV